MRSTGTTCGWICRGAFFQPPGYDSIQCVQHDSAAEYICRRNTDGYISQYISGDLKGTRNTILGAAIIDDILGIVALTIITSITDPSVNIAMVLLKIAGFFVFAIVLGYIFFRMYKYWMTHSDKMRHRHTIIAFVFCLLMAYLAEDLFGVADITGAYIAGLIISNTDRSAYLQEKFDILSYLLLSPVFFAHIGLSVELPNMTPMIVLFTVVLCITAVLTKMAGCGFGARLCGDSPAECVRVGAGMASRGEVALIVANKGAVVGLLGSAFMGSIVVMVVVTAVTTPILLKLTFRNGPVDKVSETENITGYHDVVSERRRNISRDLIKK